MEVEVKVKSLTREDLVNILSTGLYGNYSCYASYKKNDIKSLPNASKVKDMCFEEKLAEILLNGGKIQLTDLEAEECVYGDLPHKVNNDEDDEEYGAVTYDVTLDDFKRAVEQGYEYAQALLVHGTGDFYDGWNLIQIAMFGEEVYG